MPTLLDVLVGALVGEGLCPLGEGVCLSGTVYPPSVWALRAPYPFPFYRKGCYIDVPLAPLDCSQCIALSFCQECTNVFSCTRSLSLYHRVCMLMYY